MLLLYDENYIFSVLGMVSLPRLLVVVIMLAD